MKTPPHPALSLVITTYNRSDALLAVLRGLVAQTDRDFEVVVADDGSRPEHVQAVLQSPEAKQLHLTHVWRPDTGFTLNQNRNTGVAVSNGNYLVFMDGDCVPEVDFVAQHKLLAKPGCFVNGSRVLLSEKLTAMVISGEQHIQARGHFFWLCQTLIGNANKAWAVLRTNSAHRNKHEVFVWKGIRGCNLAVWKSAFEAVNGFDESFTGWGHDDADFVLRLHHAGLSRINGNLATEVFHLWHPDGTRGRESVNAATVRERMLTNIVNVPHGYRQCVAKLSSDAVITRLSA